MSALILRPTAHGLGSSSAPNGTSASQQSEHDNQGALENGTASGPGTGANTPNSNGNIYFDCTNCGRPVRVPFGTRSMRCSQPYCLHATDRFKPVCPTSECLYGTGELEKRSGEDVYDQSEVRATVCCRSAGPHEQRRLEAGRSASPYIGSDLGNLSDDGKSATKGKGKSKAKQTGKATAYGPTLGANARSDDAEFSLHRKRVCRVVYS